MHDISEGIHVDSALRDLIEASRTPLRIACYAEGGFPLVVPLWFLFDAGSFWCVTHRDAKLIELLSKDARVGFDISNNEPPYAGARGNGVVELVPEQGAELLRKLLARYRIREESRLARWLLSRADDEVALRIVPLRLSGWNYQQRMQGV